MQGHRACHTGQGHRACYMGQGHRAYHMREVFLSAPLSAPLRGILQGPQYSFSSPSDTPILSGRCPCVPPVYWNLPVCSSQGYPLLVPLPALPFLSAPPQVQSAMEHLFGDLCGASAYLTPPKAQGLAPHWDDVEVCATWRMRRWVRHG